MEAWMVRLAQFLAQSKNSIHVQYISLLSSGFQETKGVLQREEAPPLPLWVSLVSSANLGNLILLWGSVWKDYSLSALILVLKPDSWMGLESSQQDTVGLLYGVSLNLLPLRLPWQKYITFSYAMGLNYPRDNGKVFFIFRVLMNINGIHSPFLCFFFPLGSEIIGGKLPGQEGRGSLVFNPPT